MANTLLGIFSNRLNAEKAVTELEKEGFNPKDISLVMREQENQNFHLANNLTEGVATGAATGGLVGGIAGLLLGVGAISIPGIGALLIAGPIAAALGLTGVVATTVSGALTGVLAGGLVGALVGLGIPEGEAQIYATRIKEGGILIAVPVLPEEEAKVRRIFDSFGADMIRLLQTTRQDNYPQHYPEYEVDSTYSSETYADNYPNKPYFSEVRSQRRDINRPSFWQRLKNLFYL